MNNCMRTIEVFVSDLIYHQDMANYHREERTVEYKYYPCTSLNKMITDLVGDKPICNQHVEGRTVQYIIRNGRVEWHVPAEDCTVNDYLNTYPNEQIRVIAVNGIGADIPEVIVAIALIIDYLMRIDWVKDKISRLRIKEFCKTLIGRDGRYIQSSDLVAFIMSRNEWNLHEYMRLCGFSDETLARSILYYYGFECNEGDTFRYNSSLANRNSKQIQDFQRVTFENPNENTYYR